MGHIVILYYLIAVAIGISVITISIFQYIKCKDFLLRYFINFSIIFLIKVMENGIFSYIFLNVYMDSFLVNLHIYTELLLNIILCYTIIVFLHFIFGYSYNKKVNFILWIGAMLTLPVSLYYFEIKVTKDQISFSKGSYVVFAYFVIVALYVTKVYIKNREKIVGQELVKLFRRVEYILVGSIPLILLDVQNYMNSNYLTLGNSIRFFFYPLVYSAIGILFIVYIIKRYYHLNVESEILEEKTTTKSIDNLERIALSHGISVREQEVLRLLFENLSGNDIATRLFISISTVKTHISSIYRKLEVKNRVELINKIGELSYNDKEKNPESESLLSN